jgi:NhaA family Na+:H+ antiporter
MTRSTQLTEDDLVAVATDLGVNADFALGDNDPVRHASPRVEADIASSRASGVRYFCIKRRRYDGPWDESSLVDAMLGTLGHRVVRRPLTSRAGAPRRAFC